MLFLEFEQNFYQQSFIEKSCKSNKDGQNKSSIYKLSQGLTLNSYDLSPNETLCNYTFEESDLYNTYIKL